MVEGEGVTSIKPDGIRHRLDAPDAQRDNHAENKVHSV